MERYESNLDGKERIILDELVGFLKFGGQTSVDAVRQVYKVTKKRARLIVADAYIHHLQDLPRVA